VWEKKRREGAKICLQAENKYTGTPKGIHLPAFQKEGIVLTIIGATTPSMVQ
jgi:hypothetical protein